MRLLFLLVLLANIGLFAFGQGYMGTPPSEMGRIKGKAPTQINAEIVVLGQPKASLQTR